MLSRLISPWMQNGAMIAMVISSILSSRAIAAPSTATEFPLVRSSILQPNLRVPWSQPVRVVDSFDGQSLAVFDQNYFSRSFRNRDGEVKIVSLWRPNSVQVLLAYRGRECTLAQRSFPRYHRLYASRFGYSPFDALDDGFPDSVCFTNSGTEKVTGLAVKVGDRVFQLENKNGQFPISNGAC
ncbi:hypothetical protein ACKFKG_13965 [Phormidesmis sp. 146-35]